VPVRACWIARFQTAATTSVAAIVVGAFLAIRGHPPVAIVVAVLPPALVFALVVTTTVVAAARSGARVPPGTLLSGSCMCLAVMLFVGLGLAEGYVLGRLLERG
jgi:hypothetical protein